MLRLLAVVILSALVLGAPDSDPEKILRVAYASQYEWKEDGVKNATLEFQFTFKWGPKGDSSLTGKGHVVLVDGEIVRRHCPDLRSDQLKARFDDHLGWVLRRFTRKPFEEVFKETKFVGPSESPFGAKIMAGPFAYYVKEGRIVSREREADKTVVLVEHSTTPMGGGYAITGESESYTRRVDAMKVTRARTLTTKSVKEVPAPSIYTYVEKATEQREATIEFTDTRFNVDQPVALQPEARDLLKSAWEKRYVLPSDIRIQGQFQRRIDKDLDRSGWVGTVRGEFQLWGIEKLQISLDDSLKDKSWLKGVEETCAGHLRAIFDLLKGTPFEEEFKACGFELEAEGEAQVIRVYGYDKALAFRLDGAAIVGRFDKVLGKEGWWEIKSKATREGTFLPDRMSREIDDKKYELNFRYQRIKGLQIPKKMDVLGIPSSERAWVGGRRGRGSPPDLTFGIAEYSLRKAKVTLVTK